MKRLLAGAFSPNHARNGSELESVRSACSPSAAPLIERPASSRPFMRIPLEVISGYSSASSATSISPHAQSGANVRMKMQAVLRIVDTRRSTLRAARHGDRGEVKRYLEVPA